MTTPPTPEPTPTPRNKGGRPKGTVKWTPPDTDEPLAIPDLSDPDDLREIPDSLLKAPRRVQAMILYRTLGNSLSATAEAFRVTPGAIAHAVAKYCPNGLQLTPRVRRKIAEAQYEAMEAQAQAVARAKMSEETAYRAALIAGISRSKLTEMRQDTPEAHEETTVLLHKLRAHVHEVSPAARQLPSGEV